jgi:hypothetical protein
MYKILGFISEYISRFNYWNGEPHEKLVEQFYPHENDIALQFEAALRAYYAGRNRSYTVKKEVGPQGHIGFTDDCLSKQINFHYAPIEDTNLYSIDRNYILPSDNNSILQYLVSVYTRNGRTGERSMAFVNSEYKAETIAMAMERIGVKTVHLYHHRDLTPSSTILHFSECAQLEDYFGPMSDPKPINHDRKSFRA